MNAVRALLVAGFASGLAATASAAPSITAEHVTVSLVAEHAPIAPATTTSLGLHFALEDGWHVYWRNPGDSGEAPGVAWTLPAGFRAGPIEWPAPERIPVGPLANYGYEGDVLLPVRLEVPSTVAPGGEAIATADVSWLVCRAEECIPGTAVLELALPVAVGAVPDAARRAAFETARARMPGAARPAIVEAMDGTVRVRVPGLAAPAGGAIEFFAATPGVIETAAPQRVGTGDAGLVIELTRGAAQAGPVDALDGVVTIASGPDAGIHLLAARPPAGSLWLALGLALAGGVLLNLMPCVFPVLSLKVLSFVRHADEAPGRIRAHGWAFTLGVLASFWALAGALVALRAGGEQLGWGFQLQSPAMVAALAALMVLLASNLAGVFEIGLGLTAVGGRASRATGLFGSFWTGALATVVATPCTAPFMGAALGWALTQPAAAAMLVFTALGLGMAAPYVALAHVPAALRLLPRPGPWMVTVKTLLAFPLFATGLWLVWVFHLQAGSEAAFLLLGALLVLTLAARLWGEARARGAAAPWHAAAALALVATAALVGAALVGAPAGQRPVETVDAFWAPWSPEREAALRAAGTPVFVNYTAAWCLTCQVNERLVFAASDVREAFRRAGIATLVADWTDRDAAIARALGRHGRSGVPLYVLYGSDPAAPARILPQLPTRAEVIRTIAAAVHPQPTEESS